MYVFYEPTFKKKEDVSDDFFCECIIKYVPIYIRICMYVCVFMCAHKYTCVCNLRKNMQIIVKN